MIVAVAVDFGTTSTCTALSVDGGPARVVVVDGSPLMPSAVYSDGRTLFVGAEADRQAALDPSRYEPTPKRRIDDGSLLLGGTVITVQRVIAAVLTRAVREARAVVGGAPIDVLVLTHPADWGEVRVRLLVAAGRGLAATVRTMLEPVAAAVQHVTASAGGAVVAVLDVGAGTTDISVLQRGEDGFEVLATRGDPGFGGADIDQLLMDLLGSRVPPSLRGQWVALIRGNDQESRRRRHALRAHVRSAKESLSRHSYADVPLSGQLPDGHVTRADLERLIRRQVSGVVELLAEALRAGCAPTPTGPGQESRCTARVFLVGGSSRVPLFATMVHQRLGMVPVSTDQPETVVARGALLAVAPAQRAQTNERVSNEAPRPQASASALPAPGQASRPRRQWLVAAVLLLAAVVGATIYTFRGPDDSSREVSSQRATMSVPVDWQESRRAETVSSAELSLTPDGSTTQPQALFLMQTTLSGTRTAGELATTLQAQIEVETAAGKKYEDFTAAASYQGREVITYREIRKDDTVVDWYVWVESGTQVSVGCQYPTDGQGAIAQPCAQAVRSLTLNGS